MLKKEVPFEAYQHNQIYKKVKKGQYDRDDISDNALDLLSKMLKFDPTHRIKASEILQHPWILDNK